MMETVDRDPHESDEGGSSVVPMMEDFSNMHLGWVAQEPSYLEYEPSYLECEPS